MAALMSASSMLSLAAFVGVCFAAASSGAVFRPGAWYAGLRKPAWTPPNWAFPVVWSVLYLAIAVSGWLVWEARGAAAWPALAVYGAHLVINAGWSALFFGLKRLDWAMAELALLWASIVAVMAAFAPISPIAAGLLAPYLAWVSLAGVLNASLLRLNGPRGTGWSRPADG